MAVRTVAATAANVGSGSAVEQVAGVLNDAVSLLNRMRNYVLYHPVEPANFEIDTNFDIQNGDAFHMVANGVPVLIATDQNFDTGTTATTAADTWIAAILSIDADGTTYVDYGTGGQASEAAAIAALASVTASGEVVLGYVTILTASGQSWTAGTDALQGGTGGNPSDDTNYYNDSQIGDSTVKAVAAADTISFRETGTPT